YDGGLRRSALTHAALRAPDTKDAKILTHAAQLRLGRLHRHRGEERRSLLVRVHVLREADLARFGDTLDAGGDVHVLPEIIESVVQRHRDGGAGVNANLEDQRAVGLLGVEGRYL